MKKIENSKLLLILITFLLIIASIGLLFYTNLTKNLKETITATVKYKTDNYIIVEDTNNKEYKLNTKENINEEDILSITIDNIDNNSSPITADIKNIEVISKKITLTVEDDKHEEVTNNSTTNKTSSSTNHTEADIISYITTLNNDLDKNTDDKTESSLKEGFITVADFLFYDGKIYNKTFDELSTEAKLKVISLIISIDSKIEKKFPDYKEEISIKGKKIYTDVKTKSLELYLDKTVEICTNKQDLCQSAKDGLNDLKSSFSLTWENIKIIAKDNLSKLKSWYEVWREE